MGRVAWLCISVTAVAFLAYIGISFGQTQVDPRLQAGIFAGTVVVSSWFMTFFFREVSLLIDRNERGKAFEEALNAEIWDFCETLKVEEPEKELANLKAELLKPKSNFQPFIGQISEPTIYPLVVQDIRYLSPDAGDLVVQFYRTLDDLRSLVGDIQSEDFRCLPARRRLPVYSDMIDMRLLACDIGDQVVDELEKSIQGYLGRFRVKIIRAIWAPWPRD